MEMATVVVFARRKMRELRVVRKISVMGTASSAAIVRRGGMSRPNVER